MIKVSFELIETSISNYYNVFSVYIESHWSLKYSRVIKSKIDKYEATRIGHILSSLIKDLVI